MAREKRRSIQEIQEALGARRVVRLDQLPSQGPLDLLQLRAELQRRLRSSGGRPTDPDWSIRRVVPFKEDHWRELEELAAACESGGQNVSPGQLAAVLVETGLRELRRKGLLKAKVG
ncbi:MAG TPA: hypothetical protein VGG06_25020 [Thermoanaerobaculia bacterium]|jgi:hypothetical protein